MMCRAATSGRLELASASFESPARLAGDMRSCAIVAQGLRREAERRFKRIPRSKAVGDAQKSATEGAVDSPSHGAKDAPAEPGLCGWIA